MAFDKQKIIDLLPIFIAIAENKQVQYIRQGGSEWTDAPEDFNFGFDQPVNHYRVKPEKVFVPFTYEDRDIFKDRWIKLANGNIVRILEVNDQGIKLIGHNFSYAYLFENCTFDDGSKCGKEVEVDPN